MRATIGLLLLAGLFGSCASRSFKKDYTVVDASSVDIPEWVENAREWAEDKDEEAYKKHFYYSYSTAAKTRREVACKIAKANAASEVAAEISQFISQSFAQTTSGAPATLEGEVVEFMQENLGKEVKQHLVGAKLLDTYWEKRAFKKELGAHKDWNGYTCSVLMRVPKDTMKKSIERAETKLLRKLNKTEEQEQKVKEIIEKTKEEFIL